MARGGASQTKVHYKGKDEDFVVFIDDPEAAKKWKTDKTIPLAQVVSSFKVFVNQKHGAQGILDGASNATLENEFGTHVDEEVIKQIIEKGTFQEGTFPEHQGNRNDSQGGRSAF